MIASGKGNLGQLGGGQKSGRNHQNGWHKGAAVVAPVFSLRSRGEEREMENEF